MFMGGTEGFYENQNLSSDEKLFSGGSKTFDETQLIAEEKMFMGGTEGFYENQNLSLNSGTTEEYNYEHDDIFKDSLFDNLDSHNYIENKSNLHIF